MRNAAAVLLLGALWGVARVPAQTPSAQFHARVDRVLADFTAIANDGQPVADLSPGAIQLKVDGKIRPIESLQFVRVDVDAVPTVTTASTPVAGTSAAAPTTRAPEPVPDAIGRQVVLVFDQASFRPSDEHQAVEGADHFVDRLNERDRVALISLPVGPRVEFTRDRSLIHDALAHVIGSLPPPPREFPADKINRACSDYDRSRNTLARVSDLLRGLATLDGPKTVVLVSAGLLPSGVEVPVDGTPGCAVTSVDPHAYRDVEIAASAARAQFYIVQPRYFLTAAGDVPKGLPGFLGYPDYHAYLDGQLDGLQDVAGVTGGELFRLSGTADAVFTRIRMETSAYYVLAFAPLASEADGKPHTIQIRLDRKGVIVRARLSFTLAKR